MFTEELNADLARQSGQQPAEQVDDAGLAGLGVTMRSAPLRAVD